MKIRDLTGEQVNEGPLGAIGRGAWKGAKAVGRGVGAVGRGIKGIDHVARGVTTAAGDSFGKGFGKGVGVADPWANDWHKFPDKKKDKETNLTGKPIVRKNDTSAEPLNDREIQELQNGFQNLDNKGQRTLLTMMKKNQI